MKRIKRRSKTAASHFDFIILSYLRNYQDLQKMKRFDQMGEKIAYKVTIKVVNKFENISFGGNKIW